MSDKTKAVNLTEDEIMYLMKFHGETLRLDADNKVERINYLNRRLKAFKEPETEVKSATVGWGTNNEQS